MIVGCGRNGFNTLSKLTHIIYSQALTVKGLLQCSQPSEPVTRRRRVWEVLIQRSSRFGWLSRGASLQKCRWSKTMEALIAIRASSTAPHPEYVHKGHTTSMNNMKPSPTEQCFLSKCSSQSRNSSRKAYIDYICYHVCLDYMLNDPWSQCNPISSVPHTVTSL
jgi:hypothetical protein